MSRVTFATLSMCGAGIPTTYHVYRCNVTGRTRRTARIDLNGKTVKHVGTVNVPAGEQRPSLREMARPFATLAAPAFDWDDLP